VYQPRGPSATLTPIRSYWFRQPAPQIAQLFQAQQHPSAPEHRLKEPDGLRAVARVADVSETDVTLDVNHPLAGKELVFDIQLLEIIQALRVSRYGSLGFDVSD
jgi:peptidylprolyl isomerase